MIISFIGIQSIEIRNICLTSGIANTMRWFYFIVLQLALVLAAVVLIYKHEGKAAIVKTPPEELAQWYKPENKRQVWLHNMFKLRREMQAVEFHAENKNSEHLKKWASSLNKHYLKIGEMIPEWDRKLDFAIISSLETHVANKEYANVLTAVNTLQKNCDSCHNDYQAITALTYRAPDFSAIEIEPSTPFNTHMQTLTKQVNQIKIASEDNMADLALSSLENLKEDMTKLGQVCADCHKKDKRAYPSPLMNKTLLSLEDSLKTGTLKEQGRHLGTLAVLACARCHGTHRLATGAKNLLSKEPSLTELLKH